MSTAADLLHFLSITHSEKVLLSAETNLPLSDENAVIQNLEEDSSVSDVYA